MWQLSKPPQRQCLLTSKNPVNVRCFNDIEFPLFKLHRVSNLSVLAGKKAKYIDIGSAFDFIVFPEGRFCGTYAENNFRLFDKLPSLQIRCTLDFYMGSVIIKIVVIPTVLSCVLPRAIATIYSASIALVVSARSAEECQDQKSTIFLSSCFPAKEKCSSPDNFFIYSTPDRKMVLLNPVSFH